MLLQLKNREKTKVVASAITSISRDYDINGSNGCTQTIILTIGSAVMKLKYDTESSRDADADQIEEAISNVENNIR